MSEATRLIRCLFKETSDHFADWLCNTDRLLLGILGGRVATRPHKAAPVSDTGAIKLVVRQYCRFLFAAFGHPGLRLWG